MEKGIFRAKMPLQRQRTAYFFQQVPDPRYYSGRFQERPEDVHMDLEEQMYGMQVRMIKG